jgi:hypothetical protein
MCSVYVGRESEAKGNDRLYWLSKEKKKKKTGSDFEIPPEFPRWEHMQDYLTPMTSNAEVFSDLPQPQDSFLDNEILVSFLVDKF